MANYLRGVNSRCRSFRKFSKITSPPCNDVRAAFFGMTREKLFATPVEEKWS